MPSAHYDKPRQSTIQTNLVILTFELTGADFCKFPAISQNRNPAKNLYGYPNLTSALCLYKMVVAKFYYLPRILIESVLSSILCSLPGKHCLPNIKMFGSFFVILGTGGLGCQNFEHARYRSQIIPKGTLCYFFRCFNSIFHYGSMWLCQMCSN